MKQRRSLNPVRTSTSARGLDFQLEWSFLANIPLILLTGGDILKHLHFSAEWEILNPFVSLTILYTAKKAHHKVLAANNFHSSFTKCVISNKFKICFRITTVPLLYKSICYVCCNRVWWFYIWGTGWGWDTHSNLLFSSKVATDIQISVWRYQRQIQKDKS